MLNKKKEVIKHSSAIQISNNITLLERRAWNLLLANAYDDLLKKDRYKASIKELLEALCIDVRNLEHLKKSFLALMRCVVQWNVLGKDKNDIWGASVLLSGVEIENGIITYAYDPILKDKLYNPKMYAKINLSIQNRFGSKYSLALYELATDYFIRDKNMGQTSFIELEKFRELMGIEKNEYKDFRDFNKRIIKKAITEINEKSDLFLEVEIKKEARKVSALKFHINQNPNKANKIEIKSIEEIKKEIINYNIQNNFDEKQKRLENSLINDFLQSQKQAKEILAKYEDLKVLEEFLSDIEKRYKNGEIENLGAYTYKLLAVYNQKFKKSKFDIEQEEKAKKRAEEEKQRLLEEQKRNLKIKYDDLAKAKAISVFKAMDEMTKLKVQIAFETHLENLDEKIYAIYQKTTFKDLMVRIRFKEFMLEKGYLTLMPFDEYADRVLNPI